MCSYTPRKVFLRTRIPVLFGFPRTPKGHGAIPARFTDVQKPSRTLEYAAMQLRATRKSARLPKSSSSPMSLTPAMAISRLYQMPTSTARVFCGLVFLIQGKNEHSVNSGDTLLNSSCHCKEDTTNRGASGSDRIK